MQRHILAAVVALALWPSLAAAVEVSVFQLKTTRDLKRLICYPEGTTREDGVRVFIAWAQARQADSKVMDENPVIGLMRSLGAQWPCKGGQ